MEKKYFKLQLKSIFKIYPKILIITLVTILSIGLTGAALLYTNSQSDKQQKISIGIVGDLESTYLNIGLSALQNMDESRFYVDILEYSSLKDATRDLESRKINGYVHIPENYIENILRGRNKPAKYVTLNAPEGFGTIISSEIAEIVSAIVTQSQNGMYSMQDISVEYLNKNTSANTDKLMLNYISSIVNRSKMYEITTLGIKDSLSFAGYYVCALLILIMLLWGISANRIFTSRNIGHSKLLSTFGVSPSSQVLSEYTAYLIASMTTFLTFAFLFGCALQLYDFGIPELTGAGVFSCIFFIIKLLPVIIVITMMQFAFYEIIKNPVASVLMQFILAIVLGYFSGCFYPNYFFPEIIQKIALLLPVGAGFSYARKVMSGSVPFTDFCVLAIYIVLFFKTAALARKYKITGDAK